MTLLTLLRGGSTPHYWGSAVANWNTANWATTSGGPYNKSQPGTMDDAVFDSFSTGACTISALTICNSLVVGSGAAVNHNAQLRLNGKNSSNAALYIDAGASWPGTGNLITLLDTTGTVCTISVNISLNSSIGINNGAGASYKLLAPLTIVSPRTLSISFGTFDINNKAINVNSFSLGGGTATVLNQGTLWTVNSLTVVLSGLTITWPSTIKVQGTTFAGGGASFNTVNFAPVSGSGSITFSGSNSYSTLSATVTAASTITFANGSTQTIGALSVNGSAGNLVTMNTDLSGTAVNFVGTAGSFTLDYVSLQDNHLTGVAGFLTPNSVSVSGNTGWFLQHALALAIATASAVSALKNVGKITSVSTTSAVSLLKIISKFVSINTFSAVSSIKTVSKFLLIATSSAVSVVKTLVHNIVLSITTASSLSISKTVGKTPSINTASAVVIGKVIGRALLVGTASGVLVLKVVSRVFVISTASLPSLIKSVLKTLPVATASATSISRLVSKFISFGTGSSVSVTKSKIISVVVSIATSSTVVARKLVNKSFLVSCFSVVTKFLSNIKVQLVNAPAENRIVDAPLETRSVTAPVVGLTVVPTETRIINTSTENRTLEAPK